MTAYRPTLADRAQRRAFAAMLALPERVVQRLAGGDHVIDGEPLDPQIQLGLRILGRIEGPDMADLPVPQARRLIEQESWLFAGETAAVKTVRDLTFPGPGGPVPARLYLPPSARTGAPLPLLLWFHGGGWVVGSIESHDPLARTLCRDADVAVLNVGYRLAPEHPFPAAVEDAVAAFHWAHAHASELGIDPDRIAVGGDSAGGTLTAAVCLETAGGDGPAPAFQCPVVPATDFVGSWPSHTLFETGYFLTQRHMQWYAGHYFADPADRSDPRASPLLAEDLSGQPPAYVAVAGFDPLRDEGIAYAQRLRDAGVDVTLRVHGQAVHPFVNSLVTPMGQRAVAELSAAVRAALHPRG